MGNNGILYENIRPKKSPCGHAGKALAEEKATAKSLRSRSHIFII